MMASCQLMMSEHIEWNVRHSTAVASRNGEGAFAPVCVVGEAILEEENKNTNQKNEQNVRLH